MAASRAGAQLRALLKKECVAVPGAFNGLCGRIVADKGFDAAYVSGAALTASAGVPDIGILSLDHFTSRIKEIHQVSGLPLICDADTGFGEAEMVRMILMGGGGVTVTRTVKEYIHAGAAALHIEDQVFPKRCGHLDGKTLTSPEDMCEKIERAVKASKDFSNGDFVICARTDARGVIGMDEAIDRAQKYVKSGADMIFPEGLKSKEEFRHFAKAINGDETGRGNANPTFLLANMTEFGKTDYISVKEFEELGYHCVIFPVTTLRCAMKGVEDVLDVIKDREKTVEGHLDQMFSRKSLYQALRYTPGEEWEFPSAVKKLP